MLASQRPYPPGIKFEMQKSAAWEFHGVPPLAATPNLFPFPGLAKLHRDFSASRIKTAAAVPAPYLESPLPFYRHIPVPKYNMP